MAIPNKARGYGNVSTARNIFGVTFSQALSAAPKYEAYDGATFPATGSAVTVANRVLAGSAGNSNKSCLGVVDTSAAAPASSWFPASATGGSANPNRVKGQTSFVTSGATSAGSSGVRAFGTGYSAGAGNLGDGSGVVGGAQNPAGVITWNETIEIASDFVPTDVMTYDLLLRFTYTGTAPTLAWYFNEGTGDTTPNVTWTALTPGTHGLRHCNAGTVSGGPYLLDIPASSVVIAAEGWVTT
jgi:hypothetical protein